MSLVVTTIPDDPAQLSGWLERQLVGLDLGSLVGELTAIHRPSPGSGPSLDAVLGGYLERIEATGLSCLPRPVLQQLLTHPSLLIALQERILIQGGPYWDECSRTLPAINVHVERGRQRLSGVVAARQDLGISARHVWYRQAWVVSLATAAAVLIAVGVWNGTRPVEPVAETGWGWERPGVVATRESAREYLEGLADAAQEWFVKRPETRRELARRLNQMRQGCSTLILGEHEALSAVDRKWLVERCQAWAKKFDQQLADLEAGKDVLEVRQATDATVEQLVKALRGRGAST